MKILSGLIKMASAPIKIISGLIKSVSAPMKIGSPLMKLGSGPTKIVSKATNLATIRIDTYWIWVAFPRLPNAFTPFALCPLSSPWSIPLMLRSLSVHPVKVPLPRGRRRVTWERNA